ncbi:hypothetical protein QBC35DRAFT_516885 [Podospora australis]|uniref:Mandelate racemase/muconate lactonizing enzyme C-terminal domain-containing protein n=1 Tax=Podospora australis TaxID=1536484 RepID=A0AAN7AEE3_9PEZI|nr:hypothetical protein QBC35DRAFT_516885 [Podospora australis]
MAPLREFPTIKAVRSFVIGGVGSGGDYHNVKGGHWLIDSPISTPCSKWEKYRASRTSWGINVLGSFLIEIEATDGTVGFATGFGGPPACWLVHQHFERFLIGADPRNTNHLFEQMYRASLFYGRKGITIAVISVIDLAIWDLLGKVRGEPVYKLIGGSTKDRIEFYCTGPDPPAAKEMGFWGAKVPLPYCPEEGHAGLKKNVEFLRKHRESVGPDFPLMVDCYMSLNVSYTIEIAKACEELNINWWEECLSPDDTDGFEQIKRAHPTIKFTTGEHEYSRYGFRKLIEGRNLDIIQPDVMWLGGMTELLKVAAMAAAYDIPVVPHASGPYSYHFVISQPNTPFQEYLANSPDGKSVLPVFGDLFIDEPIPTRGFLTAADLDKPGFGLTINPAARAKLIPSTYLLTIPTNSLPPPTTEEAKQDLNSSDKMPPTNLLAHKTAIITGGTTGIGRAITLAFLAQGCNVAVNHLALEKDEPHLDSLLAEAASLYSSSSSDSARVIGQIAHLPGDVRDPSTGPALVSFALESFNTERLDICVSNAGICTFASFLDLSPDLFSQTVRTNLDGAFYVVQAAARQMALHQSPPGGSIIGISSISALVGGGEQTHYTPTKAGVSSLMQSTAVALGKYGVRCNALLPGTIRTQLNEEDLKDEEKKKYMEGRIPLGRTGDPKDMGGPAVFLACEELSGYVTGAQLLVDGGLFVNLQ